MTEIIKTLGILLFAFLAPIKLALVLVSLLILLDTVVAISVKHYVAKRKFPDKPSPITSKKFAWVIMKTLLYNIAIVMGFILDIFLVGAAGTIFGIPYLITKGILLMIIVREGISLDESLRHANQDRGIKYYFQKMIDVLKHLKKSITDVIE